MWKAMDISGMEIHCMMESFNAKCLENQVILMTRARYGLMERSRCTKPEAGKCLYDYLRITKKATIKITSSETTFKCFFFYFKCMQGLWDVE